MNRSLWQRWWIVALVFVVCAGLLAFLMPRRKADLQLPDGRAVSLLATTFGSRHVLEEGSILARWAAKVVGPGRAQRFGFRTLSMSSLNPSMVVWTEWLTDGSNRPPRYASIRAEAGFETEPVFLGAESSSPDRRRTVIGWKFENYPRRSAHLEIRFHDRPPPYHPNPLGALGFPSQPLPVVAAFGGQPPPVSVEEDGITFTLARLTSGEELPIWRRAAETGLAPWTSAVFEVREGGALATNWTIRRIECLGATSNSFAMSYARMVNHDGLLTAGFANVLWPDEPDWKLTAEFVQTENFPVKDLWTLRGVPVSRTNSTFATNFIVAVHGGIAAGLSLRPAALQSAAHGGYLRTTDLGLSFTSSVPEMRVELARIVDGGGRELRFGDGAAQWPFTGPNGRYQAGLELAEETTSIDITFAFQRPHRVTFVVKPAFVRTNFASTFPEAGK